VWPVLCPLRGSLLHTLPDELHGPLPDELLRPLLGGLLHLLPDELICPKLGELLCPLPN
jgi:hypothetical protein